MFLAVPTHLIGNIFLGTKEMAADRKLMDVEKVQVIASCNAGASRATIRGSAWTFIHYILRIGGMLLRLFPDFSMLLAALYNSCWE